MDFDVHGSFRFSSPAALYCRRIDRQEYLSAKRQLSSTGRTPAFLELADRFLKSADQAETEHPRAELANMTFGR
jgi:hypothetical protein